MRGSQVSVDHRNDCRAAKSGKILNGVVYVVLRQWIESRYAHDKHAVSKLTPWKKINCYFENMYVGYILMNNIMSIMNNTMSINKILLDVWPRASHLISCIARCTWIIFYFILLYRISNDFNYIILSEVERLPQKQLISVSVQIWNGIVLSFPSLVLFSYFHWKLSVFFLVLLLSPMSVITIFSVMNIIIIIKTDIIYYYYYFTIIILSPSILLLLLSSLFFELIQVLCITFLLNQSRVVRLATTTDVQAKLLIRVKLKLSAHIVSYQVAPTIAVRTCLSRSLLTLYMTVILLYAFHTVSCTLSNKQFRVRVRVRAFIVITTSYVA